jgi:hypothetical protein
MILAVLALVSATFHPAAPTVGDPITLEFAAPVTLDASQDYEVVSRSGNRVVIRTFLPKPIALSGVQGHVRFRNLQIPVKSVLRQGDDLAPAPLVPPRKVAYPRAPFLATAIAAVAALGVWALVWWKSKRPVAVAEPEDTRTPVERYRDAVIALRENPSHPRRWAALADATRVYLAATHPRLRSDLTTTEVARLLPDEKRVVVDILRQGDLEKFSKRGAAARDFDAVANEALELAS